MYLGAHYLSDVVCAAVLGALCAFAVTRTRIFSSLKIGNRRSTINRRRK
jgi:membrane-associated phospholipid phosphatase